MDIITGYRGTPHITSMQDRAKNQGVIGEGSYILDVGQQLAAEIVSANEIRVRDGVLSHQGCVANIAAGAYDSLEISNGTQGMLRTDLIVARYTKDAETNVEDISLVVIEGEAAASSPVTPSYNEGDIQSGDTPVDMPLYKVNINGVTISSVDLIADNIRSLQSIGDTALPTAAQTISGAIAEHEADISKINGNLSTTSLTRTWVDNNYIDQTSFNRTYAHKYGKLVCVFLNVLFTTSMPTGTSDVVIGKITGMTLGRSFFFLVPSQSNNSTCLFQLRSNGELWVSNLSGTATGTSWFRTTLVALEGAN